jgi:lipid A ethanolaminephosphotransferase
MKPLFRLSHLQFSLLLVTLLFIASNAINFDRLSRWFIVNGQLDQTALGALLAFGWSFALAFFLLFFAHRWLIRPMAIALVVTSAMATYFIAKYDIAVDSTMVLNTLHTDPTEVSGLLSWQMLPWVLLLILLPVALILKTEVRFSRGPRYLGASVLTAVAALGIGIALVYANYDSIHRAGNVSGKYILHQLTPVNILRSASSVLISQAGEALAGYRKPVVIEGSVRQREDLLVVLAIGESARQKSFSLYGYDRVDTNPQLKQVPGLQVLNGVAEIGTTLLALREILRRGDYRLTSITAKMGVPTACLVNFTLYDNCEAVGETRVSNCGHGGKCYDEDVLPLFDAFLGQPADGQRLAILHLGGGSHGPVYQKRFPPEFQVFRPQCLDADVSNLCSEEELYNSYDNSILYTDFVLKKLIDRLDESGQPYVFIYVSDHGESLFEEGRVFHGMPPGIDLPEEQARVPLLVKASIPIEIETRQAYTQPAIFDTVLELLNIDTPALNSGDVFIRKKQ